MPWLIAAGVLFAVAMPCLVAGMITASLALVYVSIAASLGWIPLLVVGLVRLSAGRHPAT